MNFDFYFNFLVVIVIRRVTTVVATVRQVVVIAAQQVGAHPLRHQIYLPKQTR